MSIRAKIISGYVVALTLLVAVGTVAFLNVNLLIDAEEWTAHTQEVLEAASHLEAALNFAETGARGYVIAGDPFYLKEFNDQVAEARTTLGRIETLTSDNADQQGRLALLGPKTEQLFSDLAALNSVRDTDGLAATVVAFKQGAGTGSMKAARDSIREIADEERTLLAARTKESEAAARATQLVVALGVGVAFLILIPTCIIVLRSISLPLRAAVQALSSVASRISGAVQQRDYSAPGLR